MFGVGFWRVYRGLEGLFTGFRVPPAGPTCLIHAEWLNLEAYDAVALVPEGRSLKPSMGSGLKSPKHGLGFRV